MLRIINQFMAGLWGAIDGIVKVMSEQTDTIGLQLTDFGLSPEEAKIYLHLGRKGTMSALQTSRELHVARTKVYRILDKLIAKQLVSIQLDDQGKKFVANSYEQLKLLVTKKEAEAARLREELPGTFKQLAEVWGKGERVSKVLYYTGPAGLEQVTWNSLRAKGVLRIYEVGESMTTFLDQKFAEKVREELVERGIRTLQLTNKRRIEPYTKVAKMVRELWEVRYVDPKKLNLQFECLIYNDVFCLYQFSGEEQFCVEVYNEKLAAMQKQLFDFVWNEAERMKILSDEGEAEVERRKWVSK